MARPRFEAALRRMFDREGVDTLPAHLHDACGIAAERLERLDVGVFRIHSGGVGPPLVARLFARERTHAAAQADLGVVRHLAEVGFPAERPYGQAPLTRHAGQSLLVTEFVRQVPRARRPPHPIVRLGAMIGRLHAMDVPADADRPSGALHHFAEGTMGDELRAVASWLEELDSRVPGVDSDAVATIREAVLAADAGGGLPEGFVHPDPVPKNAIFTAEGPVLVDWTSAGRGPKLASMTLVLRSGWAASPFLRGYRRTASLTDEERDRLGALLFSRALIDRAFRVCREPDTAAATAGKLTALRRDCDAQADTLTGG